MAAKEQRSKQAVRRHFFKKLFSSEATFVLYQHSYAYAYTSLFELPERLKTTIFERRLFIKSCLLAFETRLNNKFEFHFEARVTN